MKNFVCVGVLLLLASPAFAANQPFSPNANGGTEFMMPSGNVSCIYIPAGGTAVYQPEDGGPELQCDRAEPSYLRFLLGKSGKAKVEENAGDASCCSGPVFNYGNTTALGPFVCKSATSGLTCTRGGHGFSISRKKTKTW
jgi:hypothetical protein